MAESAAVISHTIKKLHLTHISYKAILAHCTEKGICSGPSRWVNLLVTEVLYLHSPHQTSCHA